MRRAVRAIVLYQDKLLVMHRNKFGSRYATLPGGNIEMGETPEQALEREITEETQILFSDPRLVFVEEAGNPYGTQYIYLCTYVSGEPALHPTSEEAVINKLGKNLHEPAWLSLTELEKCTFRSEKLKRAILLAARQGFPAQPVRV